jgi:hypothetical protein
MGERLWNEQPEQWQAIDFFTLKFDHQVDVPFYEEDSTLNILLTTGKADSMQGSPINQVNGAVRLVGSGTFKGGYLDGKVGHMVISGKINPIP